MICQSTTTSLRFPHHHQSSLSSSSQSTILRLQGFHGSQCRPRQTLLQATKHHVVWKRPAFSRMYPLLTHDHRGGPEAKCSSRRQSSHKRDQINHNRPPGPKSPRSLLSTRAPLREYPTCQKQRVEHKIGSDCDLQLPEPRANERPDRHHHGQLCPRDRRFAEEDG